MKHQGFGAIVSSTLPSLLASLVAQTANQPFTRASIMIQKPGEELAKRTFPTLAMLKHLATTKGPGSLFLGLDAAILKTAPKYMVAVAIKDNMGQWLASADPTDRHAVLVRSARIAVTAGVAGAALTNPLDVVRNAMFQTEESLVPCMTRLTRQEGFSWFVRGINKNWIAVAAPIASTIFLTDVLRDHLALG